MRVFDQIRAPEIPITLRPNNNNNNNNNNDDNNNNNTNNYYNNDDDNRANKIKTVYYLTLPVAVYDGCGIVVFVYWLRLKQYL